MVFLNNGIANATMTCDATCFAKMSSLGSAQVQVRDLWQHKTVATVSVSSGWSTRVGANGGSVMVKLTKA